ncbi:MAG: hemerythrin domain-containing protein [Casimicrobiaceae bacterium]
MSKQPATDAIALLTDDHKAVQKMFKDYEGLGEKAYATKKKLAQQICAELTIHTQIEEEIFYPAVREAIDDDDLMDEADVEHASAKDLIAQIEGMEPDESHYDAKVKVLGEEVAHHIEEEQDEMFKKVRQTKIDTKALGEQMAQRKEELKAAAEA